MSNQMSCDTDSGSDELLAAEERNRTDHCNIEEKDSGYSSSKPKKPLLSRPEATENRNITQINEHGSLMQPCLTGEQHMADITEDTSLTITAVHKATLTHISKASLTVQPGPTITSTSISVHRAHALRPGLGNERHLYSGSRSFRVEYRPMARPTRYRIGSCEHAIEAWKQHGDRQQKTIGKLVYERHQIMYYLGYAIQVLDSILDPRHVDAPQHGNGSNDYATGLEKLQHIRASIEMLSRASAGSTGAGMPRGSR